MKGLLVAALLAQTTMTPRTAKVSWGVICFNDTREVRCEVDKAVIPSAACIEARAGAIERVREAWHPRPPAYSQWTTTRIWNPPCYQECLTITHTSLLAHDDATSSACLRCQADAKDARDKAAKEQADREAKARAALDAVDAACGEPKP